MWEPTHFKFRKQVYLLAGSWKKDSERPVGKASQHTAHIHIYRLEKGVAAQNNLHVEEKVVITIGIQKHQQGSGVKKISITFSFFYPAIV